MTNKLSFFVSGSIRSKEAIWKIFETIEAAGHGITHNWTLTDDIGTKADRPEESGRRAEADIDGVLAADIYVLDSGNEHPGKGMYAELGAALATKDYGAIFIIGPMHHDSVFYYHPKVIRVATIADVLVQLQPVG